MKFMERENYKSHEKSLLDYAFNEGYLAQEVSSESGENISNDKNEDYQKTKEAFLDLSGEKKAECVASWFCSLAQEEKQNLPEGWKNEFGVKLSVEEMLKLCSKISPKLDEWGVEDFDSLMKDCGIGFSNEVIPENKECNIEFIDAEKNPSKLGGFIEELKRMVSANKLPLLFNALMSLSPLFSQARESEEYNKGFDDDHIYPNPTLNPTRITDAPSASPTLGSLPPTPAPSLAEIFSLPPSQFPTEFLNLTNITNSSFTNTTNSSDFTSRGAEDDALGTNSIMIIAFTGFALCLAAGCCYCYFSDERNKFNVSQKEESYEKAPKVTKLAYNKIAPGPGLI